MRACIRCTGYHGDDVLHCPTDGAATWPVGCFSPAFGRRYGGDHVVLEEIGRGGMATVYRAVQASTGREEALKVLPAHPADDGREARRFSLSADLARRLQDPRTVRVLDHGVEEDGTCWLAMELLPGRTLREALAEGLAPLPCRRAASIARQVLQSLDEAHGLGLVHRDVKPDNVFLVEGAGPDAVKLLDFGLARPMEPGAWPRLTLDGTALGTPAYMSPEQGHGRPLDARSDLYAVGVVLFELLTGRLPHDDASALRVLLKKVAGPAPRLRDLAPEVRVTDAMEDLVAALLEVDPARRPASAREVMDALEAATCPQEAPVAPPPGPTEGRRPSAFRKDTRRVKALPAPDGRSPALRLVRFTKALETGIPEVDRQHRDLFDLADAALGPPGPGSTEEGLLRAGEMLVDYAARHFADEEALMDRTGYPGLPDHREAHRQFREAFEALVLGGARDPAARDALRGEVRRQVSMLVRHVRTVDGALAAWLREQGIVADA